MPQMAPMWWTLIYIKSIMMLMLIMTILYFYKNYINKDSKMNYNNKLIKNWKW